MHGTAFPVADLPLEKLPRGIEEFRGLQAFAEINPALGQEAPVSGKARCQRGVEVYQAEQARGMGAGEEPEQQGGVLPHPVVEELDEAVPVELFRPDGSAVPFDVLMPHCHVHLNIPSCSGLQGITVNGEYDEIDELLQQFEGDMLFLQIPFHSPEKIHCAPVANYRSKRFASGLVRTGHPEIKLEAVLFQKPESFVIMLAPERFPVILFGPFVKHPGIEVKRGFCAERIENAVGQPSCRRVLVRVLQAEHQVLHGPLEVEGFDQVPPIVEEDHQQGLAVFIDRNPQVARISAALAHLPGAQEDLPEEQVGTVFLHVKGREADGRAEKDLPPFALDRRVVGNMGMGVFSRLPCI